MWTSREIISQWVNRYGVKFLPMACLTLMWWFILIVNLARFGSNLGSYVWVSMETFPERFNTPERGQHHAMDWNPR